MKTIPNSRKRRSRASDNETTNVMDPPRSYGMVLFNSCKHYEEPESFIFSQFHCCPIYDKETNETYWCNEQYYQFRQAECIREHGCNKKPSKASFRPEITAKDLPAAVLAEEKSAMKIVDLVHAFDFKEEARIPWEWELQQVLEHVNYLKYSQNEDERRYLLATGDGLLAEASPSNKNCGIGLNATNARSVPPEKWPGHNLLGQALMGVRLRIAEELDADPNVFSREDLKPDRHVLKADQRCRQPPDIKAILQYRDKLNGEVSSVVDSTSPTDRRSGTDTSSQTLHSYSTRMSNEGTILGIAQLQSTSQSAMPSSQQKTSIPQQDVAYLKTVRDRIQEGNRSQQRFRTTAQSPNARQQASHNNKVSSSFTNASKNVTAIGSASSYEKHSSGLPVSATVSKEPAGKVGCTCVDNKHEEPTTVEILAWQKALSEMGHTFKPFFGVRG